MHKVLPITVFLLTALTGWQGATAQDALKNARGQQPMVNTTGLPPVRFHRSPLQLDKVDERPLWHDCTRPDESGASLDGMRVPLSAGSVAGQAAGARPGGSGAAGNSDQFRRGNPMVPGLGQLPQSTFEPHAPAHYPRPLFDGTGTSLLGHVRPDRWSPAAGTQPDARPAHRQSPAPVHRVAPLTAVYSDAATSVGTSVHSVAATSVKAVLRTGQEPGDALNRKLLNAAKHQH